VQVENVSDIVLIAIILWSWGMVIVAMSREPNEYDESSAWDEPDD
jgi:hypothetical protein